MLNLLLMFVTRLLLGMRHATDPDHIVAVTTSVTHERSIVKSSRIDAVHALAGSVATTLLILPLVDGLFTDAPRWIPQ